jgi:hypothetical protein
MHTDSVRAVGPPGQDKLVPDCWVLVGEWRTDDGVGFEQYMDPDTDAGRLIAIPRKPPVVLAAYIVDADQSFSVSWTGEIDRPAAWRNAQKALARKNFAEYQRRPTWAEHTVAETERRWTELDK